jgi:hypothetical protein
MFRVVDDQTEDCSTVKVVPLRCGRNTILALQLERRLQYLMQMDVRVHVWEDQLQIFGTVASWYLKQQAQEIAREIAPEFRIRNELRVAV